MIRPYNNIEDRLDNPCENGCGGVYRISSVIDHLDGAIHCIICHERVPRYRIITKSEEDETMAKKGGSKEKKGGGKGGKC